MATLNLDTFFLVDMREAGAKRLHGALDGVVTLANGTGIHWNGEEYRVVDSWLNVERHGEDEEGMYVYLERVVRNGATPDVAPYVAQ